MMSRARADVGGPTITCRRRYPRGIPSALAAAASVSCNISGSVPGIGEMVVSARISWSGIPNMWMRGSVAPSEWIIRHVVMSTSGARVGMRCRLELSPSRVALSSCGVCSANGLILPDATSARVSGSALLVTFGLCCHASISVVEYTGCAPVVGEVSTNCGSSSWSVVTPTIGSAPAKTTSPASIRAISSAVRNAGGPEPTLAPIRTNSA